MTLLMLAYHYVVLLTYYLLKPARDSIFLVKLGADQLPVVFILTALLIVPVTSFYSAAGRSLRLTQLVYASSGVFVASLAILRWLLTLESGWVAYAFYVWVSVFGALTASQYWLFANAVFSPAQGKRLFALLNIGGILGAITGGEVTSFIVQTLHVQTEDLLVLCMAFVSAFIVFARVIWRIHVREGEETPGRKTAPRRRPQKETLGQTLGVITGSRHLSYLVGILALTMATASFVDYQFKTVSLESFPEQDRLTAFLGVFYGRVSVVSLLLQLVFAYRLVRVVGVTGIVMFLPLSLLLGSGFMLAAPGLLAASFLRGADGAFLYSLDKTGRELLFLPVPLDVKKRTKVFIDVFVDRWSRGAAGAALLLLTGVLGLSVRELSVVVAALSVAWVVLVVLVRKEYVDAFRRALSRRELDPSQLTANITDASTVRLLRDLLSSRNEREVVYALDMLADVDDASLADGVRGLLDHPSDEVKKRALEHLRRLGVEPDAGDVDPLVRSADADVRVAAIHFATVADGGADKLRAYLDDPDARVAASALRCAADEHPELVERARVASLASTSGDGSTEVRVEVARSLGRLADPDYRGVLLGLARDASDRVAGEAIIAMGATGDLECVPDLLAMVAEARKRKFARAALAEYGNSVVAVVSDALGAGSTEAGIRRNLPAVLSRIPTQQSADALASNLGKGDPALRYRVVKALNKLRKGYPDLGIDAARVDAAFLDETAAYYELLGSRALARRDASRPAEKLLERALEERMAYTLERMFRLLGLRYPADDVYNAYLGIVSPRREQRASAVELLDNVLGSRHKKYLVPIIDPVSAESTMEHGRELFGLGVVTRERSLVNLIRGRDPWLRACAVYCASGNPSNEVKRAVEDAAHDTDPVVSETARLVRAAG